MLHLQTAYTFPMTQSRTQSRGMCRACGYVGTKASMTKHQAACPERSSGKTQREVYRLRVSGSDSPEYWLDVELPVTATLDDLDGFLRGIWLECCGHMSSFTIGPQDDYESFYSFKRAKQPALDKLALHPGDKFGYTYDFGSSTDLTLQVQARETVSGKAGEKVRLLARNLPPALTCSECQRPAEWVHSWEYNEETGEALLYCDLHSEDTRDEQLPVTNSPRLGVCAYEGGIDDAWPPADPIPAETAASKSVKPKAPKQAKPAALPMLRLNQDTDEAGLMTFLQQAFGPGEEDDSGTAELLSEAGSLPQDTGTLWIVGVQELPEVLPLDQGLPSAVLVLDASGQLIASEVIPDATPDDLVQAVLFAMLEPDDELTEPQRPGQIITPDAALAFSLHTALASLEIQVEQRDIPELDTMLSQMRADISGNMQEAQASVQPRPFLEGVADEEVAELIAAFGRFMRARPWRNFAANKLLRATWTTPDGSTRQLYASVMGELGEVHGLALYPDWLSYARHLNNTFNQELMLLATGGLESLTLSDEDELAPQDWARLRSLGLPKSAQAGPALFRFGPAGTLPPLTPLRPLIAMLHALAERAERKKGNVTSLKAEHGGVKVQFPAGPRDDLSSAERAGSVVVRLQSQYPNPQMYSGELVLTGPPEMLVRQAFSEARRELEKQSKPGRDALLYLMPDRLESPHEKLEGASVFGDLHVRLWESYSGSPSLTLAHLARLGELIDGEYMRLWAAAQPTAVSGLSAELRETAQTPPRNKLS